MKQVKKPTLSAKSVDSFPLRLFQIVQFPAELLNMGEKHSQ